MRRAVKRFSLTFVILASGSSPTGLWMTAPAYIPIPRHPEYAGASEEAEHASDAPDVSEEVVLRGAARGVHEVTSLNKIESYGFTGHQLPHGSAAHRSSPASPNVLNQLPARIVR